MNAKKQLLEACCRLTRLYTMQEMTVEMFLKESDVSRGTFYKYFKNKDDLLEQTYFSLLKDISSESSHEDLLLIVQNSLLFLIQSKDFKEINADNMFDNPLLDIMVEVFIQAYKNRKNQNMLSLREIHMIRYRCGGSFCVLNLWYRRGREMPLDKTTHDLLSVFYYQDNIVWKK